MCVCFISHGGCLARELGEAGDTQRTSHRVTPSATALLTALYRFVLSCEESAGYPLQNTLNIHAKQFPPLDIQLKCLSERHTMIYLQKISGPTI